MSFRKVAVLFFLTACSSATRAGNNGQLTGAAEPKLAAEQFLRAIKANDLQAMSTVWGTQNGPVRETMERTSMEKREIILVCYLTHDTSRVVAEAPGAEGRRDIRVELKRGNLTRQTTLYTIRGPRDRWYVENVDIAAVRDFCGNSGTSAGR
ncbi:MAG TPA: hypothetical protein VF858_03220 [Gemmatimonadaceae bacterium]